MSHDREERPVLIVEDDESTRFLISLALDQAGITNVAAATGEEALDLLACTPVAALLLDNNLPGMTGIEVLRSLRARTSTATLPVIMVTGDDDLEHRVTGLSAGADDYLVKPFDIPELIARVRAHLRGQAAWSEIVGRHLRERAAIANALAAVGPGSSPEATARNFCQELMEVEGVASAAILAFTAPDVAVVLASEGKPVGPLSGRALPSGWAKDLCARSQTGPWLADVGAGPPLACAPILRHGSPIGVLIVQPESTTTRLGHNSTLAAAIDYASIATGLLGLSLEGPTSSDACRTELERVIDLRSFGPVFQPIVSLATGEIEGYEALTRFDDGHQPDIRFAEARALGLGIELEQATLRAAIDAAARLPEGPWVSLNVSPDLVQHDQVLEEALSRNGRRLVLELTEHDPVENYGSLRAAIDRLGGGLELSIDDAGSGFASLRHVLALEPAYMKLDQTWISGVQGDPARQALIAGLVHFARQTGCRLIAEGIESTPELGVLTGLDVDLGQGYLLGRPAPVAA